MVGQFPELVFRILCGQEFEFTTGMFEEDPDGPRENSALFEHLPKARFSKETASPIFRTLIVRQKGGIALWAQFAHAFEHGDHMVWKSIDGG